VNKQVFNKVNSRGQTIPTSNTVGEYLYFFFIITFYLGCSANTKTKAMPIEAKS